MPKDISLVFLPPRSPELGLVENMWQYLRANWLSSRVFESYQAIIDAAYEAWDNFAKQPDTISCIAMPNWLTQAICERRW